MMRWNILYSVMSVIFYISKISENTSVKINVYPKIIKVGESLNVECFIYNISNSDRLKTFFYCPFQEITDHCYADCESICQIIKCQEKTKFINTFKCCRYNNQDSRHFMYSIPSISKEQINDRKILSFSCKYRGLAIWENIPVVNELDPTSQAAVITDKPQVYKTIPSTSGILIYGLRDIIILILIFILLISFFINIWCCIQLCMRNKKYKKMKRDPYSEINAEISQRNNVENNLEMHDFNQMNEGVNNSKLMSDTDYYIRRARSNPVLPNNFKNTHGKLSTSNAIQRPGSANDNLKDKPTFNNSINEIYQNRVNNEQIYPYQGQQIMRFFNPQFIPPQYMSPQSFIILPQPCYNDNISSEKLNEYTEEDSPESSSNRPLPNKPNSCSTSISLNVQ